MASDKILNIADNDFQSTVMESDIPVLVDFWAPWCGPCRAIAPVLEELAEEYGDKIKIVKMNVDENQETPMKFQVRGIPTLLVVKGGEVLDTLVGAQPKEVFKGKLDEALA